LLDVDLMTVKVKEHQTFMSQRRKRKTFLEKSRSRL